MATRAARPAATKRILQKQTKETKSEKILPKMRNSRGLHSRGKGRGADGPKSGVERRIWKFIKGASPGESSLAGFGGSLSSRSFIGGG